MKKPSRKTLKRKADKLWREIIHSRGSCEICGESFHLNAHHIVTRGKHHLRWDIRNGCLLCVHCHYQERAFPLWFADWMRRNRLKDYRYLLSQKNIIWDKNYHKVFEYLEEHKIEE